MHGNLHQRATGAARRALGGGRKTAYLHNTHVCNIVIHPGVGVELWGIGKEAPRGSKMGLQVTSCPLADPPTEHLACCWAKGPAGTHGGKSFLFSMTYSWERQQATF